MNQMQVAEVNKPNFMTYNGNLFYQINMEDNGFRCGKIGTTLLPYKVNSHFGAGWER